MKSLRAIVCIFLLSNFGFIHIANAGSDSALTIVGGAAINFKNSDFDVGGKKLSPSFITLDISGALAYDKYYIAFNYDPTLKEHLEHDTDINQSGEQEDTYLNITRVDYSTAIGMNVWETVNIFAGWKFGETAVNSFSNARSIQAGNFQDINFELYFREEGPFVGTSYTYKHKDKGNLSLSLAYAQMAGEIELKSIVQKEILDGDTTGLSYGLEWSGPLSNNMIYKLGYKAHRYRFKQDGLASNGEDFSSDVLFNMFYLGVANYF